MLGDEGELRQRQTGKRFDDLAIGVDAVSVKDDTCLTDGDHEKEGASGGEDALQFGDGLEIAVGIDRITIAAQPDVFDDVHAGEGIYTSIGKREIEDV